MISTEFKYYPYELTPKSNLNALTNSSKKRQGLWLRKKTSPLRTEELLQDTISRLMTEFFDYIYWPELGDTLQTGPNLNFNSLIARSISKELSFLNGFISPFHKIQPQEDDFLLMPIKSNFLITQISDSLSETLEIVQEQGFETLKFKITKNFESEIKILSKTNLKYFEVRLDCNSNLEPKNIIDAASILKKIPNLEYLEDPTPYCDQHWETLAKLFPLAYDQALSKQNSDWQDSLPSLHSSIQYFIVKPSRCISRDQIMKWAAANKKITLTNMMDSSLGTWKAAIYFNLLKKEFPKHLTTPGIYTHHLYEDSFLNEFLVFQSNPNGAIWAPSPASLKKLMTYLQTLSWQGFHG